MSEDRDVEDTRTMRARAGGALTHPLAIASVLVLVLNDHVFKHACPSWLTGKLSDVAGLVFFPLLLEAIAELAREGTHRYKHPSRMMSIVTITVTAVGFTWVKTTSSGHAAYGVVGGLARYPLDAISAWIAGGSWPALGRAHGVKDASDLLALVGLFGAAHIGRERRTTLQRDTSSQSSSRDGDRQS